MITTIKAIYSQYKLLISCCLLIILAWVINLILLVGDTIGRGTFGDMFGGLNALFTGLAFATLIYTAWMQKEELALQREELAATREELKGQKEQLQYQSRTFELQRFESTFFSLLSNHQANMATIDIDESIGVEGFRKFWYYFLNENQSKKSDIVSVLQVYDKWYRLYQSQLGRYFRSLYHIFKFINSSNVDNKKLYASIVRAQLSSFEQFVLFYNCLSYHGNEKFKPLLEEFSLLNNLPIDRLVNAEHADLYIKRAYE